MRAKTSQMFVLTCLGRWVCYDDTPPFVRFRIGARGYFFFLLFQCFTNGQSLPLYCVNRS